MRYGAQPVLMTCPPTAATTVRPSAWPGQVVADAAEAVAGELRGRRVEPVVDGRAGGERLAEVVVEDLRGPRLQVVGLQPVQVVGAFGERSPFTMAPLPEVAPRPASRTRARTDSIAAWFVRKASSMRSAHSGRPASSVMRSFDEVLVRGHEQRVVGQRPGRLAQAATSSRLYGWWSGKARKSMTLRPRSVERPAERRGVADAAERRHRRAAQAFDRLARPVGVEQARRAVRRVGDRLARRRGVTSRRRSPASDSARRLVARGSR